MTTDKGELDMEAHVLRFRDLAGRESSYRPIDMLLSRFERDRYSVIGRPVEQNGPRTPLHEVDAFNVTYLKCAPGKGIGTHAHAKSQQDGPEEVRVALYVLTGVEHQPQTVHKVLCVAEGEERVVTDPAVRHRLDDANAKSGDERPPTKHGDRLAAHFRRNKQTTLGDEVMDSLGGGSS